VDAKERLRLYLEQRRELGEYDLVLDKMPVADVLALLGARDASPASRANKSNAAPEAKHRTTEVRETPAEIAPAEAVAPPPPPQPRFDERAASSDWRAALKASGVTGAPASAAPTPGAPANVPPVGKLPDVGAPSDEVLTAKEVPAPAWLTALDVPLGISVGAGAVAALAASNAPASLDDIAQTVAQCTACALHASAIKSVPGEGNPNAHFMCVGEGPGQQEDETGKPFVGPSGQLLTKILGAIALSRDDVFIANVVKHRPPGNRDPLPAEVKACRPFLEQQLALVRPRVILALGTFAAQTLLETTQPLGSLRGQIHRYHGIPLIVTYHPAALLRNEAWTRPTWQDVQLARRIHDASLVANPS
jgi:DNA polymerase